MKTAMLDGVEVRVQELESKRDFSVLVGGDVVLGVLKGKEKVLVYDEETSSPRIHRFIGIGGAGEDVGGIEVFEKEGYFEFTARRPCLVQDGKVMQEELLKYSEDIWVLGPRDHEISERYKSLVDLAKTKWAVRQNQGVAV